MQQFMHTFQGVRVPDAILRDVEAGIISSFCLFSGINIESPEQLREMSEQLRHAAKKGGHPAPLIGTDQEGGQLMAIQHGVTPLAGNMALGATRSPELAYQAGRVLARELLAMGVNMNFAPSLDVNINPANPVIGVRSFGDDPELVAELGSALLRGSQDNGVMATVKHFPGHGDTASDTHHETAVVHHTIERLHTVELVPFKAAVAAGVGAVMTAHIVVEAWDKQNPATISRAILGGVLRREMGFDGLIVTDAMDMHAVARLGAHPSIDAALSAGADLVMLGHLPHQEVLSKAFAHRVNASSVARIQRVRQRYTQPLPDFDTLHSAEHQDVARQIAERSVTLVKNGGLLPLRAHAEDEIAVVTVPPMRLTPADTSDRFTIQLAEEVQAHHPNTRAYTLPNNADDNTISSLLAAVETAKFVVVGTINAVDSMAQSAFVRELHARGKQPIVIALRLPYDINAFPQVEHYLCTYSIHAPSMRAVAGVLFGTLEAQGVLPCHVEANVLEVK